MNNNKKVYRKTIAILLLLSLIISLVPDIVPYSMIKTAQAAYNISNPRVSSDTTTWDCIYFGNYWQNDTNEDGRADTNDSKQPIKWRVLSVNGNEAFIVADKALDCVQYNETHTGVTWETCTLRAWLNGMFYNNAFNSTEQTSIETTMVINENNIISGADGGNNTYDKIFLLSQNEVRNSKYGFNSKYDTPSDTRISASTAYAKENYYINSNGNCNWWLRSSGNYNIAAAFVHWDGGGNTFPDSGHVNVDFGVRPALNINLSSSAWSFAGTVTAKEGSGTGSASQNELGLQSVFYKYGSKTVNVLTTSHSIESSHNNFSLECKAYSSSANLNYYLDTGKNTVRSSDGKFKDLKPADFETGNDIYITVKDSNGNAYRTKILLKVTNDNLMSGTSLSFGKGTSFTLGDDVPLIGGSEANFLVPSIPVSVVIEDGKIKVGYNIKEKCLYSANSDEGVTTTNSNKKKTFKQKWEDIKSDMQKTGYINKDYRGYLEQCDLQGGLPGIEKNVDFNIVGYAEGTWSSDNVMETISGELVLTLSGSATARKQLFVWIVPISLRIEASASGSLTGKITYDFVNSKWSGDLSLLASISLEPFAGIGVSDWLSVGVYGKGTASIYATLLSSIKSSGLDKVTIQGQAGIKGYFAKKEVINLKLIDSPEKIIYTRENSVPGMGGRSVSTNKLLLSNGVKSSNTSVKSSADIVNGENLNSVVNRNITESDTEWLEDNNSDKQVAKLFGAGNVNSSRTVVSDIYGAANPQMAAIDGLKVYGYVDETGTRETPDQTVAKYVVYDEYTGTSSNELIIDDDGTADYKLKLVTDGNDIYAVYLNSGTVFGEDEPELSDYAKSFKVSVARFDIDSRRFVKVGTYHKSDSYCYNPALAIVDNGFHIAWSENEDNEIMALTDTNHVYSAKCDASGSITGSINSIASNVKAVTSLAVDKNGNVVYAVDKDNMLTTEPQNLYCYSSDSNAAITDCASEEYNVRTLIYQKLPGTSADTIMCVCDGILSYYDSNSNAIKYVDESAYIGNSSDYYICGDSIYFIGAGRRETDNSENNEDILNNRNVCKLTYNGEQYVSSYITDEEGFITSFATDGTSHIYVIGTADYGNQSDETIDTTSKLKFVNKIKQSRLEVQDVDYDYSEFTGDKAVINPYISNTGTETIDAIKVMIEDSEYNEIQSQIIKQQIVPGETAVVELTLDELDNIRTGFSVNVVGLAGVEENYAEATAQASYYVDMDKTELAIEGDVRVEYDDNTYVHLDVTNSSAKDTSAVVTLSDGDNEVYREEIAIAADSSQGINITDIDIPDNETPFIARVETDDKEFYDCDNEVTILVRKLTAALSEEVDSSQYDNVDEAVDGAHLQGHSLSLEGNIGVNYYMELDSNILADEGAYMLFTLENGDTQKVYVNQQADASLPYAKIKEIEGNTYYGFQCLMAAKEMTDTIKAQIHLSNGGTGTEYTYSVKQYADYMLEHSSENEEFAKAMSLIRSMLNYGAYSQTYFNHNTTALANVNSVTDEQTAAIQAVDAAAINKAYDNATENLPAGVTFAGANLELESETILNLYFTNTTDRELVFRYGDTVLPQRQSGDYTKVSVSGITANELDSNMTVVITIDGEGTTYSVTYSPMNYCYNVLARETNDIRTDALKNVIKALYIYNQEAKSYFNLQ